MLKRYSSNRASRGIFFSSVARDVRAKIPSSPSSYLPACRTCRCSRRRPRASMPSAACRRSQIHAQFGMNLRNGLAEGRYQIAHSAVDNAFALPHPMSRTQRNKGQCR